MSEESTGSQGRLPVGGLPGKRYSFNTTVDLLIHLRKMETMEGKNLGGSTGQRMRPLEDSLENRDGEDDGLDIQGR